MTNRKIKEHLKEVFDKWVKEMESVFGMDLTKKIRKHAFIAGGALASLLKDETPNDYDIYFTDKAVAEEVYDEYIEYFIRQAGEYSPVRSNLLAAKCALKEKGILVPSKEMPEEDKVLYFPLAITETSVSLKGGIQVITRFTGEPIHLIEQFDFAHTQACWVPSDDLLYIKNDAMKALATSTLKFTGSEYPLASLFRTRKFLKRGWKIPASEYLKIAYQLSELDLRDPLTLRDQLVGVDILYFQDLLAMLEEGGRKGDMNLDFNYICAIINAIDEGGLGETNS